MSIKTALRRYIQRRNLQTSHSLQDCLLVIDGDSFFKESYKNSGCQFLLGPECDKYANYLHERLECFSKCNIKCYFIFKGSTRDDLETREKFLKKIIDDRRQIENNTENPVYFNPLLTKDIQKQVLDLMGIKYFNCKYESIEATISVARVLKCPVLTDHVEYCLYGVSCIQPDSITWEKSSQVIQCTIYDRDKYKSAIGVYNKMPLLLTVLSMIPDLPKYGSIDDIHSVIQRVKRLKNKSAEIANNIENVDKKEMFNKLYNKNTILYLYPSCNLALKYFQRGRFYGLFKDDKKWFSKGVAIGRIAVPYVDMKRNGLVTGSTVVNDIHKPDAIQAAVPIIAYAHCILTNSQNSKLKYIGRQHTVCATWDSEIYSKIKICNRDIFNKYGKMKNKPSSGHPFRLFIKEFLSPKLVNCSKLLDFPKDSIILVITLFYYIRKVNKQFIDGAYYLLLSYLILGPVQEILDAEIRTSDVYQDCKHMYDKLHFLFRYDLYNLKYDTCILHSLAEFSHCLQHMNYLNNLCKQNDDYLHFPSTLYNQTYNATFVYNTFIFMKSRTNLMSYLERNFKHLWPLKLYNDIVSKFEEYLRETDEEGTGIEFRIEKPFERILSQLD